MTKVRIFTTADSNLLSVETEINEFLKGKKFISLDQSVSHHGEVLYTLVYKEVETFGDVMYGGRGNWTSESNVTINPKNKEEVDLLVESLKSLMGKHSTETFKN